MVKFYLKQKKWLNQLKKIEKVEAKVEAEAVNK